jgi:hypothetical protein
VLNGVGEATGINALGRGAENLSRGRVAAGTADIVLAVVPLVIPEGRLVGKAVNLPAWRTIGIDMEHIASGHMSGGARSAFKTLFPDGMTTKQVERAVRTAYRYGEKIASQGDRVLMRGEAAGLTIELWVNKAAKVIESAYPK